MRAASLLVVSGAAFWAYRRGYFYQVLASVKGADPAPEDAVSVAGRGTPAITPAVGGETVRMNKYEVILRENLQHVSRWAQDHLHVAAAIMAQENGPANPALSGDNGTSHGLFQVKVATAETCRRAGYEMIAPTRENLLTVQGGVYFGTAEMERLARMGKPMEWIIAAYNGGAGWEQMPAKYQQDRRRYVQHVAKKMKQLYGEEI